MKFFLINKCDGHKNKVGREPEEQAAVASCLLFQQRKGKKAAEHGGDEVSCEYWQHCRRKGGGVGEG